ncbi:MAG: prepilin-type N-terminal cleavage/methylation domain-containing protein [Deferribacteraceae bacterium]|jgi:prepilin-type N-terminal cleavage/methylation domain-containing protein|nr:prepilin-type N-terminal cleavage/methylation domain-containing protein [Deferribacteraceae bacterium]
MLREKAFTLIEILVVIAVIGIMMMAMTPVLGERIAKGDAQTAFFNDLLKEHLEIAKAEGVPVEILGFKGSDNMIKYDGDRISIPGIKSVQSARINGENSEGVEYLITVYPDGLCDHFVLETNSLIIESSPLLMTVRIGKI